MSRLSGRLLILVWAAILLCAAGAKAEPARTLVQDTLYRADGSAAQGTITIRWNGFTTSAGEAVEAGSMTETIGSGGSISIPLIPNTGASPSGSYYRVFLKLDDGTTSEEQWVVPAAATTTVAAMRAKVVPQAVAAQFVSRDYVDTLLYKSGINALTTPGSLDLQSSVTASSPVVDIRAFGAVIDGATDIGPALAAATAQACTTSGVVFLPCSGSGCYLANGVLPQANQNACAGNRTGIQYKQQGILKVGTTLVVPDFASWMCDGAAGAGLFVARGPNCLVIAPQVYGSLGTAISGSAPITATFTPTMGGSSTVAQLAVGTAITVAENTSCNIASLTRSSAGFVTATLGSNECRIPTGTVPTIAGVADSSFNITPILLSSDYYAGVMTWQDNGVKSISINNGGSGYTTAPAVSFSGGGCAGTSGTATVSGGAVTGVTLSNQGVGCTSAPTVAFSGGAGSGAAATATIWAAGSTTGGTVTGFNDDTFETVLISANSGTTVTAQFAHAHPATASFGAVGVMPGSHDYNAHYFQGLGVAQNYGAGFYFNNNASVLLDGVSSQAENYIASEPLELSSTAYWRIENSSFFPSAGHGCGTACGQQSYPYGIHLTSSADANTTSNSPSATWDSIEGGTTIGGGIKIDTNDQTGFAGEVGGFSLNNVLIEQPSGLGITIDSRYLGVNYPITLNSVTLQDNFNLYSNCLIGYTDPLAAGGVNINTLHAAELNDCITNPYYGGTVNINGLDYNTGSAALPRYLAHVGVLNDGITLEAESRNEGASMGPQLIPYATQNVTTNPASWSCSGCTVNTGIEAPDGTATAGELVTTTTGNDGTVNVLNYSTTPHVGDWIISGVWCMPGVNNVTPCTFSASSMYTVAGPTGANFDNSPRSYFYPNSYTSPYFGDWWHPIVSANKITSNTVISPSNFIMQLKSPDTAGFGIRIWQPFFMYIPISAKPSSMTTAQWDAEIARWRQWLLHGYVPPNMPANVLAINPALKMMWGSDTNLYRGAAGVVQSDGSFNVNGSGSYQVNGTPTLPITSLTTTGTSGAATLSGGVLNIPQYAGGGVSSINGAAGAFTFTGSGVSCSAGTCTFSSGSGSGAVGSGTAGQFGYYAANGTAIAGHTIVATDIPTLNQNTTGTAGNLSGTPGLPNGTTATTQTAGDNSAKLATDAFVATAVAGIGNATTVNGGSVPASAAVLGSNSGGQVVASTAANVETALGFTPLNKGNNLSDVASPSAAITNLGAVATSTTVNGHALSGNVTLGIADLNASYGQDITSNGGVLDSDGSHATSTGCVLYGDSITAGVGATVTANSYANLLTTRVCGGATTTHGYSGDSVADGIYRVLQYAAPGDSGVPAQTMLYGVNDATFYTSPTSVNKVSFTQFEGGAAAWLALSSTNKVMANNSSLVTQAGATWTADSTFADAHGLTTTGSSTLTDSNCYVGPKGVLYLWYYLYGSSTGSFSVTVDGVTQTDTITGNSTLSAQYQSNAPRNVGTTTAGMARFAGLSNGSHSCAVSASGSSGNPVGMIGFGFPPTNRIRGPLGPNVYMGGVIPNDLNANSSNVVAYNGYALGVSTLLVGDGLPVKFVDVYDSMDPYLDMTGTAAQNCPASTGVGVHPNDCGHNKLFAAFSTSIKPTTVIPLNQASVTPSMMWNWNPQNLTGSTASMPNGETFYCNGSACAGHTFAPLNLMANVFAAQPVSYAETIFSSGSSGTSFCYGSSSLQTASYSSMFCPQTYYQGAEYFTPNSTSDANASSQISSSVLAFRTRTWNGTAAGNEDYWLSTVPSSNGNSADVYFQIKNGSSTTTGGKGLWVENSSNHGWKLKAGNTSYDATMDTTAMTSAATIQPPAGWTGTVSLQAGLNLPNGTPTFTAGTNVTSVACASGYTCTNTRGELTVVGGTATTGTIATVNFSAALAAAPGLCRVTQNGGTAFFGIGEGQPTTTAFAITAGSSVASATVTVDYQCIP